MVVDDYHAARPKSNIFCNSLSLPHIIVYVSTSDCEMDQADTNGVPGMIRKIVLDDPYELTLLKQKLEDGSIISGQTTIDHGPGAAFDDRTIRIPPGIIKSGQFGRRDNDHRRLATLTGTKPILVVRVTDGDGQVIADSPYQISDNVFGTYVHMNDVHANT